MSVSSGGVLKRYDGRRWNTEKNGARWVSVASDGTVAYASTGGRVYRRDSGSWDDLGASSIAAVGISSSGTAWMVDNRGDIYRVD